MDHIISEIVVNFINEIKKSLSAEKPFALLEPELLNKAKACTVEMLQVYMAHMDSQLLGDKVGRRKAGYVVERKGDKRQLQTQIGEVCYERTYYKKASGGYEYLLDTYMGIESRERVSESLLLSLSTAARDMSYEKASTYLTNGAISRQTVMSGVRRSEAVTETVERRKIPELHIDADEAHVTLLGGKKSEVPLISVYEKIKQQGNRRYCEEIFHISEYGKTVDELWEQALTEIERRYDLTDTKIYIHGDGAQWIQTGFEWIPGAIFVLDKYHKNKAITAMVSGLPQVERKEYSREIRWALENKDMRFFNELKESLCMQNPERTDKIINSAGYLRRFADGISICKTDERANGGGCTEPHVSHVLSARLSSRPMAWSKSTLSKLAPILAGNEIAIHRRKSMGELPKVLHTTATKARKTFNKGALGSPHPDAIGVLPVTGKVTSLLKTLKSYA